MGKLNPSSTHANDSLSVKDFTVDDLQHDHAFGQLEGRLQRVGQPGLNVRPYGKAVNHDLDVVPEVAVQRGHGVQGVNLAVNPRAGESSLPRVVEDALVLTLAVLDHRRQDEKAGALVPLQDEVPPSPESSAA